MNDVLNCDLSRNIQSRHYPIGVNHDSREKTKAEKTHCVLKYTPRPTPSDALDSPLYFISVWRLCLLPAQAACSCFYDDVCFPPRTEVKARSG